MKSVEDFVRNYSEEIQTVGFVTNNTASPFIVTHRCTPVLSFTAPSFLVHTISCVSSSTFKTWGELDVSLT